MIHSPQTVKYACNETGSGKSSIPPGRFHEFTRAWRMAHLQRCFKALGCTSSGIFPDCTQVYISHSLRNWNCSVENASDCRHIGGFRNRRT
ncbi:hypothetical protein JTE90_024529 [Oedothorax gibbosus]|uniref:Uncharacterized protein n=1 Tax=Oedothorax gibbosus TaxID=931172 RepID=A0AAV6VEQ2_9ARAC|nr:hypothetical protein JTE90_024529 [Oedothorax gibbosus]